MAVYLFGPQSPQLNCQVSPRAKIEPRTFSTKPVPYMWKRPVRLSAELAVSMPWSEPVAEIRLLVSVEWP